MREWFEKTLAVVLLVVMSPLFLFAVTGTALTIGSPIFFRQQRSGYRAKPFTLIKFRTMMDLRSPDGDVYPDRDRITKFGQLLRKTSIDELPELLNIVRGEMAFVGPRPLPVSYIERYSDVERMRLQVRPGLTGWAQVNGRNEVDWNRRLALDVWYVNNRSLLFDIRIVLRTFVVVFTGQGIFANDSETMDELRPSSER